MRTGSNFLAYGSRGVGESQGSDSWEECEWEVSTFNLN